MYNLIMYESFFCFSLIKERNKERKIIKLMFLETWRYHVLKYGSFEIIWKIDWRDKSSFILIILTTPLDI